MASIASPFLAVIAHEAIHSRIPLVHNPFKKITESASADSLAGHPGVTVTPAVVILGVSHIEQLIGTSVSMHLHCPFTKGVSRTEGAHTEAVREISL